LQKIQQKLARMRQIWGHFGLIAATGLSILACAMPAAADGALDAAFQKDVLIIEASAHACYRFDIYLAADHSQRARGLMHVRRLPRSTGMLFVYEAADYRSMWMKNTYIPLDILFVRGDGRVSSVAKDTEPLSLRSIASIEPVTYVLELNSGVTDRLSIDEKSRLLWGPTHDVAK
jgi:uncharacterized membrane protein (UPF0127 family)